MKKIIFIFSYLLFLFASFEAISFIGYYIYQGKVFSYTELNNYRSSLAGQKQSNYAILPSVAHPYLGNVHNPDSTAKIGTTPVSDYGFFDDKSPIQKKNEQKVIVGIFGASVAWWLSALGSDEIVKKIKSIPEFSNRRVEIIKLGIGGNKQPQQLMILNYLLTKGAEFDFIINLDGFNEIAIPPTHNQPKGVNPSFPAYWSDLMESASSMAERELLGEILVNEKERKDLAKCYSKTPLRQSISANLFWLIREKQKIKKDENLKLKKQNLKTDGNVPYVLRGPKSKSEFYEELTNTWLNSSLLMNQICKARGIKYFHFLQPNQYVPNSKQMSAAEKQIAIDKSTHWEIPVLNGYPLLIKKGQALKAQGVNFFDLTEIFKKHEQILYNDNCCHLNLEGNQILGREIGQIIIDNI